MSGDSSNTIQSRGPLDAVRTTLRNGAARYMALKNEKESRTLLASFLVSIIGLRISTVALVVLAYQLGEGALGVGGMLAIQMIPGVVFQPLAGSLVDRFPGKRLLVICQFLMILISLSYLLVLHFDSLWLLYAITFIRGLANTIDNPSFELRIMSLTPNEKRGTANAVQSLTITFAEVVGPLIGGLLLAVFNMEAAFIASAVLYGWFAVTIAKLPQRVEGASKSIEEGTEEATEYVTADKAGYRGLLKRPTTLIYLASVGSGYILYFGVIPLYIVKAVEIGLTEESVGIFYSLMGFGGLLGGIFSGMGTYTTKQALAITGVTAVCGAIAMMVFGIASSVLLALPMLVLVGMLLEIEEIPAMTYFQNSLPESVYGRFFSLFLMVAAVGGVIGSLMAPLLADRSSIAFAVTALGIPAVVFGLIFAIRGGGLRFARNPFALATVSGIIATPTITTEVPLDLGEAVNVDSLAEDSLSAATEPASD